MELAGSISLRLNGPGRAKLDSGAVASTDGSSGPSLHLATARDQTGLSLAAAAFSGSTPRPEGSDKWPFHFPAHAANDLVCTFAAKAWFVSSVLDESRKNVRNG
jgi:hypothetical protein